jgi:magnesium chelatase family protein
MIASVAGELHGGRLIRTRPFRAPHHSASMPALVGGGLKVRPGEISLAHLGVLFLDELPEFQRPVLDSLRQPLETGTVTVARANTHVTFPARVQLIAAMNPCRCGHLGDPALACSRAPRCAADYQARVSGPMLDRIELSFKYARGVWCMSSNISAGLRLSRAMRIVRRKRGNSLPRRTTRNDLI